MKRLLLVALVGCAAPHEVAAPAPTPTQSALGNHTATADEVTARLYATHRVNDDPRVFVLLGDPAPAGTKLTRIGHGYDPTASAAIGTLAAPRTFTLITENGACSLSSSQDVYVAPQGQSPEHAIELDSSLCHAKYTARVAIEGPVARADEPGGEPADPNLAAWIERVTGRRPMPDTSGTIRRLPLSKLTSTEANYAYNVTALLLRRGDDLVAQLPGETLFAEVQIGDQVFVIVGNASTWRHLRALAP